MQRLLVWCAVLENRIMLAFAGTILAVAAAMGLSWHIAGGARQATGWVIHTHEVLSLLASTRAGSLQVEYSTQSYRVSGDPARLVERDAALAKREVLLEQLDRLLADNPRQEEMLGELRQIALQRKAISLRVEELRKTEGQAAAAAYASQAPLAQTRRRMADLLDAMEFHERQLLLAREAAQAASRRGLLVAAALATLLVMSLLVATFVVLRRQLRAAQAARAALDRQHLLLELRVEERTAELHSSERHLRGVIDNVPALVAFVDPQQRYVYVNEQYRRRFAAQREDITGCSVAEVLGEARYRIAAPMIARVLEGQAQSYDWQPFEGVWQLISYVPCRDADSALLGYYVLGTDITERKRLELAQREATIVFENSHEAIMVADAAGHISKINPAFTRITGYRECEVIGRSPSLLASGRHGKDFYETFWRELEHQGFWRGEIWDRRKNGQEFAALQSISVVRDAQQKISHFVSVFIDISENKAHEAELSRVANYDPLTELPNRRLLSDRLMQTISRADRSSRMAAICFLDLDGFKVINDQHGHAVGDELLVGVAHQLQQVLRADDTLARLGGDEFVILLADIQTPAECSLVLERVLQAVRQPVSVGVHRLTISASIGVSLYPADNADPDTLLRHADQAMYLAKQAGKDRYQLFDPETDRLARDHRVQLIALSRGLQRQEFQLFYQPKVDLRSGVVIGVEALLRWQHPELGLLAPGAFLSHLHGSDLERSFGEWVIEAALSQIECWAAAGLDMKVSVNISANHLLQADFVERLNQTLARHRSVDPAKLELEVLETAGIADTRHATAVLQRCMNMGLSFSLDDFGTGYSSLTYLRELPVGTLKIDQSFVRNMLGDTDDLSIVKAVIELARAFHRQVIAEGVETLAHGAALLAMGCNQVQGYGIARPMPADQLAGWCRDWRRREAWVQLLETAIT